MIVPLRPQLLASVFRRLLAEHHSITGRTLTVNATITDLTDEEFDAVWDALDEVSPLEEATIRMVDRD